MTWLKRGKILGVIALLIAGNSAMANDKVTMRLDWVYGTEHSGIFTAIGKGFFADEGIDLQLAPGEGSSVTLKLVGTGETDFGYASADQAVLAASRDLPVVATAVVQQRNPAAVIFAKSSGIKSLSDLYGKRLGLQLKSKVEPQWRAIAAMHNIDTAKINEVAADQAIGRLLIAGRIDAGIGTFYNDAFQAKVEGVDTDWLLFADLGLDMYATSLITNKAMIEKNPDLVRRFTRAFVKGWEYASQHPDEAYQLSVKFNDKLDNPFNKMKLPEVLKLLESPDTKANGVGHSTKEGWDGMIASMVKLGMLNTTIDPSQIFTNEFLK